MARPYTRTTRASDSRINESRDTEVRDDDYEAPIFMDGTSGGFPRIPDLPGFHTCWVRIPTALIPDANNVKSFTSAYGYEPIRPEEIAGYDHLTSQQAIAGGSVIQHKDTIACKIPLKKYRAIMAGFDIKATQQYGALDRKPDLGPSRASMGVHLSRSSRPFRTVEFED